MSRESTEKREEIIKRTRMRVRGEDRKKINKDRERKDKK